MRSSLENAVCAVSGVRDNGVPIRLRTQPPPGPAGAVCDDGRRLSPRPRGQVSVAAADDADGAPAKVTFRFG
jgi:hypothetical protein